MPTTVYQRQNGEDVLGETEPATRSGAERGATSLLTRHAVGLAALVLTMASAYLASRPNTPQNAQEVARLTDDSAEEATDETTVVEIEAHIREIAVRYRISPHLVAAIVEVESEFNPRAVSRRGARGLMQLMPGMASSLQIEDMFDPYENIEGGVRLLRRLMDRFQGNVPLVLAAYNAGEPAVLMHGGIPPYRETRRYVARILRRIGHGGPSRMETKLAGRLPEVSALTVANPARIDGPVRQALERRALEEIDRNPAASSGEGQPSADAWPNAAEPITDLSRSQDP